jgi:tetratricopeptide (TPR) repeat protein
MLASLDYNEDKLAEARSGLLSLLSRDPGNADAQMLLGEVEEATGNNAAAIEHYRKVIEADQRSAGALNNLAYTMSSNPTQLDEALKYAQRAKELVPESSQIQDTLGWIYYRKGMYQLAARELGAALARETRPSIQFHLGLTYQQLGNTEKGGRLVAAALAVNPKLME